MFDYVWTFTNFVKMTFKKIIIPFNTSKGTLSYAFTAVRNLRKNP